MNSCILLFRHQMERWKTRLSSCFCLLSFILFQSFHVYANNTWQVLTEGKVQDESGQPLSGVNINVKGTSLFTTSNAKGEFSIEDPAVNGVLVFSYVGYTSMEI